jgi:sugar lactone lactonase YvrE
MFSRLTLLSAFLVTTGAAGQAQATINQGPGSKVKAVPFYPEKAPELEGVLAPNRLLQEAVKLGEGQLKKPEDVAIGPDGMIYTGSADGKIYRLAEDGYLEVYAETDGMPLGMDFAPSGELIVCDTERGLLAVHPSGEVEVLSTEADGIPYGLVDDVKVSDSGIAYFSDASSKFAFENFEYDILEARPNGRLLAFDLLTRDVEVVLDDLYFANGVAVAADESFVLVAETTRYQITRKWLQGERAGEREILVDNLPGSPDGISLSPAGDLLIAFYSPRSKTIDLVQKFAWLKNILARLPKSYLPKPESYGFVGRYNLQGEPLATLHDPSGQVLANVTSVEEFAGRLYIGSLQTDAVGVVAGPAED